MTQDAELTRLQQEALRREASLADPLNSWARESGVEQGQKQEDAKAMADRLWAHWSKKYHEALAQVAARTAQGQLV